MMIMMIPLRSEKMWDFAWESAICEIRDKQWNAFRLPSESKV